MARKSIEPKYVRRLQKNDMDAFTVIYEFYQDMLYYFAYSLMKNKADAEEVVQETFIQVLNSIHSLTKPESFHPWILKITYHTAMHLHKKNSRVVTMHENFDFENSVEEKTEPKKEFARSEVIHAVSEEIKKMPEKLITVAQLRYFDDLTTREIADVLSIPEGTVKTRLARVRKLIQPSLSKKGFMPTTFYSITMAPVLFKSFVYLSKVNEMAAESSTTILHRIISTSPEMAASTVRAGSGFLVVLSQVPNLAKIGIVCSLATGLAYGSYEIQKNEIPSIQQLSYYKEYTNKDVEVEVLVNNVQVSDITITKNGKVELFELNKETLKFIASSNGIYHIKVKDEEQTIELTNIDKRKPHLVAVTRKQHAIGLKVEDDLSGIDYKKSKVIYQGMALEIPKDGILKGDFEGDLIVSLYDYVGNMTEYTVEIDNGEEIEGV